jgi:hypothetical protein
MRQSVEHSMRLAESGLFNRGGFRFRRWLVTLTYAGVDDWQAKHIARYLNTARMWAKRRAFPLRYTWVAELQQRGAVHYHICFWVPRAHRLPYADLSGWWPHGRSNGRVVRGGCSGVMAYLGKYMSKTNPATAAQFPKGARLHGNGGLQPSEKRELRYRLAPMWVRDALGTYADIRKIVGGWMDLRSGEFVESLWRVWVDGSGRIWAQKKPLVAA